MTLAELKELVRFDPSNTQFYWAKPRVGCPQGKPLGWVERGTGYLRIGVNRRQFLAHRLVWLWTTGEWPDGELDHINRDRLDNRFENLRPATRQLNSGNTQRRSTNKSGFKGVSFTKGKWRATLVVDGRQRWLGYHDTPEAAHAAYVTAAKEAFGRFHHPG